MVRPAALRKVQGQVRMAQRRAHGTIVMAAAAQIRGRQIERMMTVGK